MRAREKRLLLIGGLALFAVALLAVGRIAARTLQPELRSEGSLAVVLLPAIDGSELAVVDPDAGRVVRRVRLRSLATDIAVDASSGLVVAAQSGGIGGDADDAVSVTDVRSGEVRYVTLPVTDPGDVACVGGRAFVLHSVIEAAGSVVSVVDVASGRVVGRGHVADCAGLWSAASGALWSTVGAEGAARALVRIGQGRLDASLAVSGGPPVFGVAGARSRVALLGPAGRDDTAGGLVRLFDGATSSVVASVPVTGLARAPRQAATVGDRLMVGDWSGDEPEGRVLAAFDASTLRPLGAVPIDGVPCALAAWRDRLLVVDRTAGRLLVVDPTDGRTLKAIVLGAKDPVFSDVVVVGEDARAR